MEITSTDLMVMSGSLHIAEPAFNVLKTWNIVFKSTNSEPQDWQLDSARIKFEEQYDGEYQRIEFNCLRDYNFREFVVKSDIPEINGAYTKDASLVPKIVYTHNDKDMNLLTVNGDNNDAYHRFQDSSGNIVASRDYVGQCLTGSPFDSGSWTITESGNEDDSILIYPSKPSNKRTF